MRRADSARILPKRWVLERTFGWMPRWKRHVRDYEQRLDVAEAMMDRPSLSILHRPPQALPLL
jgi:transposase